MKNTDMHDAVFSEVLVFKTNILTDEDVEKIRWVLTSESNITRWNIDRDDIDKVLRIECDQLQPDAVIRLLRNCRLMRIRLSLE